MSITLISPDVVKKFSYATNLTALNIISTDLINSSEPSGCEATQFAVAVTNQNALARRAHVKANSVTILVTRQRQVAIQ